MSTTRILFLTTTSTELSFPNASVNAEGEMTYIWRGSDRLFGVPTKNVVVVETVPPQQAPAPPPEPQPVPANGEDA